MPYDDPDPTDPNMLVGVVLRAGAEATRDMAYVFAEEFARMGLDGAAILDLFKNPSYAGAHRAYRTLGADEVSAIVNECVAVWGRAARKVEEAPGPLGEDVCWLPWPRLRRATPMPDEASEVSPTSDGGE